MQSTPLLDVSRDTFVANVLWIGVGLACQGQLDEDTDFRGNRRRGTVSCNDGQGDSLEVAWDERGVVLLVHEKGERALGVPELPASLQELAQQAVSGSPRVTAYLWISGSAASPRLRSWPSDGVLGLVDAFFGPPLRTSYEDDEDYALERELFDAILGGQEELTENSVAALLEGPVQELADDLGQLEAARLVAENLSRFGLSWPNLERDVEQHEE
jgi:hypothetical protein